MELTKSELEVMTVLWKADKPLSRNEIITSSERKSWKDSSIHILLNSLLEKQAIKEDGFARSGKVWGRLYAPNIACDEYYAENVFANGGKKFLPLFFSALINNEEITPELITELEAMLEKRKKELNKS